MIPGIPKYLLVVVRQDNTIRAEIPIFILPPAPTVQQAQALRVIAERGCDTWMYEFAARTFDLLDMSSAAESMRRRADHYKHIP